ncbi:hypothetical protein Fmac_010965 [Flemingia macrophylla]|uniref:Uncharacterized protein n=1 Tax=Flemingia macrophylla TaxID=520843 RepID=A0ABD1ML46_9FABA
MANIDYFEFSLYSNLIQTSYSPDQMIECMGRVWVLERNMFHYNLCPRHRFSNVNINEYNREWQYQIIESDALRRRLRELLVAAPKKRAIQLSLQLEPFGHVSYLQSCAGRKIVSGTVSMGVNLHRAQNFQLHQPNIKRREYSDKHGDTKVYIEEKKWKSVFKFSSHTHPSSTTQQQLRDLLTAQRVVDGSTSLNINHAARRFRKDYKFPMEKLRFYHICPSPPGPPVQPPPPPRDSATIDPHAGAALSTPVDARPLPKHRCSLLHPPRVAPPRRCNPLHPPGDNASSHPRAGATPPPSHGQRRAPPPYRQPPPPVK